VLAMVRWYSMRVRDTRATQRPTATRGCVAVRGWFHKERGEMYDLDRRDATRHVHASIRSSLFLSFHSRAFPGRLRASSTRPRAHRLCLISCRPARCIHQLYNDNNDARRQ
jgi:hypothetical protein